jgi:hypothetical protein
VSGCPAAALSAAMPPEELNAKAIIAAALIQSREVVVTVQVKDAADPWTKYDGLRRLHMLTNLIYEAISSPGRTQP